MIRATTFAGRNVAVFGLGASGSATVRALEEGGAKVAAWDDSESSRAAAEKAGLPLADLSAADWTRFSSLVLAPGVPLTHPEPHWTVAKAKTAGVEIIGDVEIFVRERAAHAPVAPFIAITGTNGKSTTTALVTHILRHAGKDVQMGGNIGRAVLTLEPAAADRFHVVELSSFQIDLTPTLKPTVGVLLNITPDHIDRHGSIANYAAVKERLAQAADIACVGVDDAYCLAILQRRIPRGPACAFSATHKLVSGYSMVDTTIDCSNADGLAVRLADLAGIGSLRGAHNAENALAAIAAVRECLHFQGAPTELDWQGALATFPGLAHRMEEVGRIASKTGSILFINDSKATNADSTEKALLSFPKHVYWILGGKPKEGGIDSLAPYFAGITKAYLIGEATEDFAATLQGRVVCERCGELEKAVAAASSDALASNSRESIILLSPACASFDQFRNFEVRGDMFRELVSALPGIEMRAQP